MLAIHTFETKIKYRDAERQYHENRIDCMKLQYLERNRDEHSQPNSHQNGHKADHGLIIGAACQVVDAVNHTKIEVQTIIGKTQLLQKHPRQNQYDLSAHQKKKTEWHEQENHFGNNSGTKSVIEFHSQNIDQTKRRINDSDHLN